MPPVIINQEGGTQLTPSSQPQPLQRTPSTSSAILSQSHQRSAIRRPADRRSELICRIKYSNNLADIPFDPKFLTYPFESNRFVQYKPTSLEKNYKHDLLTEHDLGVEIDLINPDTYICDHEEHAIEKQMAPEDEKLLEDETVQSHGIDSKRSIHHNKVVPWLKKTEYISTEFNRYGASSEKTETKVGYNVKKLLKEEALYMDKDTQIAAINRTFEEAKKPINHHHTKKGVFAVETLPVMPDFSLWKYPFAQVQFDTDPASTSTVEEMAQAMIRGVMDEKGEQFVAYFMPTQETLNKRLRDEHRGLEYVDGEEYEYHMAREYNWLVKNKASKGYEENYLFILRKDGMFYNELETKVRLSKRRQKLGAHVSKSKLVVKHRPINEQEIKSQEFRLNQLEPPQDDDEVAPTQKKVEEIEQEKNEEVNKDDAQAEKTNEEKGTKRKASSSSSSSSGSSSGSGSSSSSDSSEDEEEAERKKKAKKEEAEIFGSASDSD